MASGANQLRRLLQEGRSKRQSLKLKSGDGRATARREGMKTSDLESACNV